ncbi:zinc-binding dehydrogenase [Agrobacterium tumefaciens]|uniref:zinc-binding dehydrogenase n=1 Tax=Agrobacterium tumefaciens TaxID=358 RepID=UPI001572BF14|nr:zinc-binding dehydrogenase [Agrobacterium tumefaciens]NTB05412.1 zinc-binding dehydrogenase [Agrobacterium tumefaciens]NTE53198.1 zinc-binding dehydrogenase [Agrobacterium tumefaciens]
MKSISRELHSTIHDDGTLTLALVNVTVPEPAADEIVIRVEGAPINPSDLTLLLGPADLSTLRQSGTPESPILTFDIPADQLASAKARIGQTLRPGNEGAGTVVVAGAGAQAWLGRRVATLGGAMYADHRVVRANDAIALPEGASAAEGAAISINPLTALGFIETARNGGHKAIIHTAAASSLGQILQRICLADGIPLINIVRSAEQAALLREIGATYVLNSRDAQFFDDLVDAVAETGATVVFDAVGGGTLGSDMLRAIEKAAARDLTRYSPYGSAVSKHLYSYGMLDYSLAVLDRLAFGFDWSVSGWLMTQFLQKAGPEAVQRLRQRVNDELTTTFATQYTRTIGLVEALDPVVLASYQRKATGAKFLIDPSRG